MRVPALRVARVSGFFEGTESLVDLCGCDSLCEFGCGDFGCLLAEGKEF